MRKPKLTDEQIVALLREAERGENTIAEICKKAGISEQTFYRWRNKFSGNTVQDVRKLKQLEKDNARLLRLLGQRDVEIDAMKELLAKNGERSSETRGGKALEGKGDYRAPNCCPAGDHPNRAALPGPAQASGPPG